MDDAASSHRRVTPRDWLLLAILLTGLLLLLLSQYSHDPPKHGLRQKAQFHSLEAALELFANEFDHYPPSDANDGAGLPYCGAMKLSEAMMGWDLLGFHSQSAFRRDGVDPRTGDTLYDPTVLKDRRGPFLPLESACAYRLVDIYGKGNTAPFLETTFVLCDTYMHTRVSGVKTGMPILYYRAHVDRTAHDVNDPDNPANIYDYRDNQTLIALGVPGKPGVVHPLADPKRFYRNTLNHRSTDQPHPYNADRYILISAGPDGLYGTADDICNFEWKYREP
jgi:hypothetical protein